MNAEPPPNVRARPTAQWTLDSLRFAVEVGYGIRIRASDVHILAELFAERDALKARVDLLTAALTDALDIVGNYCLGVLTDQDEACFANALAVLTADV